MKRERKIDDLQYYLMHENEPVQCAIHFYKCHFESLHKNEFIKAVHKNESSFKFFCIYMVYTLQQIHYTIIILTKLGSYLLFYSASILIQRSEN